jgi:hypothetical protein
MIMYDELKRKETEWAVACFKFLHVHFAKVRMADTRAEIRTGWR